MIGKIVLTMLVLLPQAEGYCIRAVWAYGPILSKKAQTTQPFASSLLFALCTSWARGPALFHLVYIYAMLFLRVLSRFVFLERWNCFILRIIPAKRDGGMETFFLRSFRAPLLLSSLVVPAVYPRNRSSFHQFKTHQPNLIYKKTLI